MAVSFLFELMWLYFLDTQWRIQDLTKSGGSQKKSAALFWSAWTQCYSICIDRVTLSLKKPEGGESPSTPKKPEGGGL